MTISRMSCAGRYSPSFFKWYGTLTLPEQKALADLIYNHFKLRWGEDPLLDGCEVIAYDLDSTMPLGIRMRCKNGNMISYALCAHDRVDMLCVCDDCSNNPADECLRYTDI